MASYHKAVKSCDRNFYFSESRTVSIKERCFILRSYLATVFLSLISSLVKLVRLRKNLSVNKLFFHENISQYNSFQKSNNYQLKHDGIKYDLRTRFLKITYSAI